MSQANIIQKNCAQIILLQQEAKQLLEKLIGTPSFSKEEDKTADLIQAYLRQKKVKTERKKNNIWALNMHYDAAKPTLLLNSHHDTVKPNKGFTIDPFTPIENEEKLFLKE